MKESISFDRIAERYDATRGGERRGTQLAADIAPLLEHSEPVFEVGAGTGVISLGLRRHGFATFGLDISGQMLARAYERLGPTLIQGDAMHLPLASAAVGQMLSVWVLHLVGDVRDVMDEVVRCLRPGGRYLVMDGRRVDDPNNAIDEIWVQLHAALGREEPYRRVLGYAEHAKGAGLRVVDIVPTGPYPVAMRATVVADNIEGRVQSWMWSIPDDLWRSVAPDAVAKLRALPHADAPVLRNDHQEILVLEK